jgi:hypothetical protein
MGVASVQKIEMGLKCYQWWLKKLETTVTGATSKLLHLHSASEFSWQPLAPFKSHFNFPDQLNQPKQQGKFMQRPKMSSRANWQ